MPDRWALVAIPIVLAIAGCTSALPGSSGAAAGDRLHEQAQAALARWAAAVGAARKPDPVFVGELTSQVGDWEEAVGENNKMALLSGKVRPVASLSMETPPPGEIRWSNGSSTSVALLSAAQALDDIVESAGSTCSDCRPLEIADARLTSGPAQTSRGPATVPIWEFGVQGTNAKVTRVAVAQPMSVVPLPWDPFDAPEGISIDSASGTAADRQLTVSFVGAPARGDQPCGADYAGEAVEAELALVVIVIEHPNPTVAACTAIGARRTTTVDLAAPLGDRVVLEVKQGLPVPVLEQ